MTLQKPIERGSIDARQTRGAGHVARGARDKTRDVLLLEVREHMLLREVVRIVENILRYIARRGIRERAARPILVQRQVVELDLAPGLCKHHEALDDILQLAHVAAPRARLEKLHRGVAEARKRIARRMMALPELHEEMVRENRDV